MPAIRHNWMRKFCFRLVVHKIKIFIELEVGKRKQHARIEPCGHVRLAL